MSDTPRTDAKEHYYSAEGLRSAPVVFADFARELERELAQRTAERDEARRIACSAYAEWRRDLATERNWDCWKKEVQP